MYAGEEEILRGGISGSVNGSSSGAIGHGGMTYIARLHTPG